MDKELFNQLDNPAWYALTGPQSDFAEGNEFAKRYRRENLPFLAYDYRFPDAVQHLDTLVRSGDHFFLIGELPPLPDGWELVKELPCLQMIQHKPFVLPPGEAHVELLSVSDRNEMYDLVQKVQPGYYEPDTCRIGNYFGIRQSGKLVAMAGERMRVPGMSELSAICTDPEYTGRKYAQHLMVKLCDTQRANGIIPFLHVLDSNERAVKLYEYMGFETRRTISFWKLMKQ